MNKKAALTITTIIGFILGLLVLLLLTRTLFAADSGFRATENCPGVCNTSCAFPAEIQHSSTCRIDGKIQGTGVCCVSDYDLQNPGARRAALNEEEGGTITESENTNVVANPSIQIRRGQSPAPVNHASTINLNVGETANFKVWGFGVNQGVCSVYVLDSTKEYVQENFAKVITRELCTDANKNTNINQASDSERQNVKNYQITPTAPGRYEFVTILRDSQGNQIQSAIIYLNVIAPLRPTIVVSNGNELISGTSINLMNSELNGQISVRASNLEGGVCLFTVLRRTPQGTYTGPHYERTDNCFIPGGEPFIMTYDQIRNILTTSSLGGQLIVRLIDMNDVDLSERAEFILNIS